MPTIGTGSGSILQQGTLANRPTASTANQGYYYFASDVSGGTLYQSTGSAWVQIAASVNAGSGSFSGTEITAQDFKATGLSGATGASRYAGATASGAPATGSFAVGDFTVDQTGSLWICTSAGTPGTWTRVVAGSISLLTTEGDLLHYHGGAQARLALGAVGQKLTVVNGSPYLSAPSAPGVSTAATGGTVAAGTYPVAVTYVNAQGETTGSANTNITTTGTTSTITITSPAAAGSGNQAATGWYAYVGQAGGASGSGTRQQAAGSPTAIGTNLTITAPPTNTGAALPGSNTAGTAQLGWA